MHHRHRPSSLGALALILVWTSLIAGLSPAALAEEQAWTFMPIEDVGARTFRQQHPEYDGRGAVLAVLDTGVDMSVPGLLDTPQGLVKVIDARDFTGQGTLELSAATWVEESPAPTLEVADGLWLEGFDRLAVPPAEEDLVWTGVLEESAFLNSDGLHDLDDDGDRTGRWGIVVYAAERVQAERVLGVGRGPAERQGWGEKAREAEAEIAKQPRQWIFVIDRDADGHLDDEELLRDYAVDYQWFSLRRASHEEARHVLAFAVGLCGDEEPTLRLHHDDGGHGTHVAGIAAGHSIHGQEGLDGVAPGARVISCKLGDNRLSGGSTVTESMKKAYEYVGDWSDRYGVPVVVNMSFGIGSEITGDAAMETWLDEFLDEHPRVVVVTSAGNSGPGLSTVGLPAATEGVICVAAQLSKEAARDLYGGPLRRDELFSFSSRGGEMGKPDIAAPGVASSTVPLWSDYDRYQGTSMAAPQVAGTVACMLSGLHAEGKDYSWGTIKRALQATAKPMEGYSRIETGPGVAYLPDAFEAARRYADAGESTVLTGYHVTTEAPGQPDGESAAAYWRTGGVFPVHPRQQHFTVTPRFHEDFSENQRNQFYRAYRLKSDVRWINLDRRETYINGDSTADIYLSYDGDALREPGLYVGRVTAEAKGAGRSGASAYEFDLVVTIVVPYVANEATGYELSWENQRGVTGQAVHRFVRVPPGATSMEVEWRIPEGKTGRVRAVIHDPQGRRVARGPYADDQETRARHRVFAGDDLLPGVWEVLADASFTRGGEHHYDLFVRFAGMHSEPAVLECLGFDDPGKKPSTELTITPLFADRFRGHATGEVDRYERSRTVEVEKTDVWEYAFTVGADVRDVAFDLRLPEEIYNRMTDVAVNVLNADGEFVVVDGFGQRDCHVSLDGAAAGRYTLQVKAGFALAEHKEKWSLELTERWLLRDRVALSGTVHGERVFALYPDVPTPLEIEADGVPPRAPEGFANGGELRLIDEEHDQIRLRVPVLLTP